MTPKMLKGFDVFVNGVGHAGLVEEATLPTLTLKTEEWRAGGRDVPIEIDMGMEKLEGDITLKEYNAEILRLFAKPDIGLTLRGGVQDKSGAVEAVMIEMRGTFKEFEMGSWKAGEAPSVKYSYSLDYYRFNLGGSDAIEIDSENMIRRINGSDQLDALRRALGK